MAYGDDILDLFGADPEKAKSQAELLAQAMRSRRAAGTLGTIVGGPFAAAGKQFSGDADQIQQELIGAGQHRAQMDVQRQHYEALAKHQATMEDQGWGRLGIQRGHLDAINQRLALQGIRYNPNTGEFENVKRLAGGPKAPPAPTAAPSADGAPAAVPTSSVLPGATGAAAPPKFNKMDNTQFHLFGQALDPYAARGGLKAQMDVVNRANRLKALSEGNPNPDRRQVEEFAIGLNALLSGSNAGAQAQVEALVPHTVWGDVKKLQERITNEPTGLDQQKFVSRILDTISREHGVAMNTAAQAISARIPEYANLRGRDKKKFDSMLAARGIDPAWVDDRGVVTIPAGAAPQVGGGGAVAPGGTDAAASLRKKYGL